LIARLPCRGAGGGQKTLKARRATPEGSGGIEQARSSAVILRFLRGSAGWQGEGSQHQP